MARYLLARLIALVPILLGTSVVAFFLIRLVPGDPAIALLGLDADPQAIAALRQQLALDQPIVIQYVTWIGHIFAGDFGRSVQGGRPVLPLLLGALGPTALLAAAALAISLAIAIPAGIVAATRRNTSADYAASFLALCGLSMPSFWLGVLLILAFSIYWPILPASGYVSLTADPLEHLRHLVLPALTLGAALAAATMRMTRATMLEVLRSDYVRTARAKGLPRRRVVWGHALRNARIPIVTLLGIQLGQLLGGVVVTETVFSWPGIGKLTVDAIFARDYPVVQGAVLLTAVAFVLINLATDLVYTVLDPRVRLS
ncbi:ABC transporter permease [Variovorax ginsengisoli]|uniref:ABC transporter permease n=1 Tax=Variovorax ginsengisoli TaxID=363844 RepID=A0ABT8SEH7_9BURK|nr:ABC transporter permease [Variovorax ginsengisoli]MDN8618158.1 ABC transporter permease [Variovorax ginsengisoli]MDO1537328.1 ABC transporter permease [Variovorax ginsengisoli]